MGFAIFMLAAAIAIWYICNVTMYHAMRRMMIRRLGREYRRRARALAEYYKSKEVGE